MSVVIDIKPLSVNQAWQGRRYKTKKYTRYSMDLMWLLPNSVIVPDGALFVFYEFGFSSKASDWDNPIKPFQDILQKKYGLNDNKIYLSLVKKTIVEKGKEFIRFEVMKRSEAEQFIFDNAKIFI